MTKSLGDAENTPVIDTDKLAFGRYYKFEIPATIKATAKDGVDIENTASQTVHQYDPTKKSVEKPKNQQKNVSLTSQLKLNLTSLRNLKDVS